MSLVTESTEKVEQSEVGVGDTEYTVLRYSDKWTCRTEVWDSDDLLFALFNHLVDDETMRLCIAAYKAGFRAGDKHGAHQAKADIRQALGL